MASLSSILYSCALALLLSSATLVDGALEGTHHVVSVESLLPNAVCTPSHGSDPSSLQVLHRHGPCSPLNPTPGPTPNQLLTHDQSRVSWLHSQASASAAGKAATLSSPTIPAREGGSLGTGNYVVTVGFGTPRVPQSVIFDTGSDLTWIQCQPCLASCYPQQDPLFDPSKSSTYANISCSSPFCSSLDTSGCSGSTCLYAVQYGDYSQTVGFFAHDTLTLSPSAVIPAFRFGCGEKNGGLFGRAAGLIGLGRNPASLVTQTAGKFRGVFSYCLPATSSSAGYLTFGSRPASNVQFTPMLTHPSMPTFYFLDLVSISVGGRRLPVPPSLFSAAGTIIDSGTVISRLPPTAYSALRAAFRQGMSKYPAAPSVSILDTCYDLSGRGDASIPKVALQFRGATVDLDPLGVMYAASSEQVCLAFAPNGDDAGLVIIGNTQQKTFDVVYDVSKKLIGFGPGGC